MYMRKRNNNANAYNDAHAYDGASVYTSYNAHANAHYSAYTYAIYAIDNYSFYVLDNFVKNISKIQKKVEHKIFCSLPDSIIAIKKH